MYLDLSSSVHRRCILVSKRRYSELEVSEARVKRCLLDIVRIDGYLMQDVFGPLLNRSVIVYLDNIMVYKKCEESCMACAEDPGE